MTTTAGYAPSLHLRDEKTCAPLRLRPVTRSQTLTDSVVPSLHDELQSLNSSAPPRLMKYPRIVVKDPTGRTLDTFTALQEAIYRASWTRKKMGEWPKTPLEWRLPKAPVPSRPDYSRAGPKTLTSLNLDQDHIQKHGFYSHNQDMASRTRRIDLTTDVLVTAPTVEIAVDDVAFIAESLNHLPNLPSFSFLRQSILAGQATYIQIVASILLHQKQLRATEHREAEWEFPGFCTGCKRAGFCYGCSKNPKPHVHEDIPAMTGGGFRYWKRDRPLDPHNWKHPGNWRLPSSEEELRNFIEQYGGLSAYEQAVLRAKREMSRRSEDTADDYTPADDTNQVWRLQRLKNLGSYPPYVTIVSTDDFVKRNKDNEGENQDDSSETRVTRRRLIDDEGRRRKVSIKEDVPRSQSLHSQSSDESVDRTLVRVDTGYFEDLAEEDMKDERLKHSKDDAKETDDTAEEEESNRGRYQSRMQTTSSHTRSESSGSPKRGEPARVSTTTRNCGRLDFVDKDKELLEDEATRLRRERAKQSVPFGTRRDDIDYKAPKFFQVQKQSRKITVAKDPFSDDRDLNVPKGPMFQLKKSEKKVTQFVDFKRDDRGWTS